MGQGSGEPAVMVVVPGELARFLGILAHPDRIRLVEVLWRGEQDVKGLQQVLSLTHSRVSQHLAILRGARVVKERRQGRHVFYQLVEPKLAPWLAQGLEFIAAAISERQGVGAAVEKARLGWLSEQGLRNSG